MTREFIDFVKEHLYDDTSRLLLSAARYPSIDMSAAVQQIEGMRMAKEKWPSLLQYEEFRYPPRLNREQSSSEATAEYKAGVADALSGETECITLADLTGGMGIDSIAVAQRERRTPPLERLVTTHVDYVERDPLLCSLMEHNCKVLGLDNLAVHRGDSLEWLSSQERRFHIIYIDPARRSATGHKVAAFEECEPNILQHMPLLLSHCRWLIVKASPMIDLNMAQQQLGEVAEVHIISVKGECKEVLFVCGPHEGETRIHCMVKGAEESHNIVFTHSQEAKAEAHYCSSVGQYLYEPDAALMKGGPFNLICQWMGLEKLARNTHLYTSNHYHQSFYGRTFCILQEIKLDRKTAAAAIPGGKAHVVTRNFPIEAATLQRQLGLNEGGELFVIATTVGTRKAGFLCCLPSQYSHFFDAK